MARLSSGSAAPSPCVCLAGSSSFLFWRCSIPKYCLLYVGLCRYPTVFPTITNHLEYLEWLRSLRHGGTNIDWKHQPVHVAMFSAVSGKWKLRSGPNDSEQLLASWSQATKNPVNWSFCFVQNTWVEVHRSRDSSCGSNLHILMFFFHLVVIQLLQRVEGEKLRMKKQQWPKWLMDMGQLAKQSVDSSLHLGVHQTGSWRIGACSAMRSFCTRRVYFRNIH